MDIVLSPRQLRLKEEITTLLDGPLPGWSGQKPLSPIGHHIHPSTPVGATEAAVNLLLKPSLKNDGYTLIYIKRGTKYGNDQHKGQVSFAGGKREQCDVSIVDCALRETEEEIGIPREQITVLGALSSFYVFISGFIVYPFVAIVPANIEYDIDPNEVAYVLEVDLDHLLDPKNLHYRQHSFKNKIIEKSPYFDIGNDEMLWGATAMMTNEFLTLLRKGEHGF